VVETHVIIEHIVHKTYPQAVLIKVVPITTPNCILCISCILKLPEARVNRNNKQELDKIYVKKEEKVTQSSISFLNVSLHNMVGACITTNKRLLGSPLHSTNYTWEQLKIETC
jgi:hypothetical protein